MEPVSYTHLDVYKRQDWLMLLSSLGRAGMKAHISVIYYANYTSFGGYSFTSLQADIT